MKTTEEIAPACWAPALVNDDWSGMDDDEERRARAWIKQQAPWRVVSTADEEPWFSWSFYLYAGPLADPHVKGGEVITYILMR